jgi:drug/metabolite transporter (DMT)-like permease
MGDDPGPDRVTAAGLPPIMNPASERKALAVLVFGACIIGIGPILVRLAETGPAAAGFWRLGLALPWLAVFAALQRPASGVAKPRRDLLVIAGLLFAPDLACWHYGIHFTSVANATVLSNLTPILVTGVAWLMFKERPARVFLLGLTLAVGGAVLMGVAKPGTGGEASGGVANPHLGDVLSAATAIWYGGYFLVVREARKTASATTIMLWSSLIGTPIMLILALLLGERVVPLAAAGWAACIGLGLMHVGGQGAIAWSLGRLPASLAAVVVLVQPVVAAGLGWVLLGERMSPVQGLGAALALAGVAVAQVSTRKRPPVEAPEAEQVPTT